MIGWMERFSTWNEWKLKKKFSKSAKIPSEICTISSGRGNELNTSASTGDLESRPENSCLESKQTS